MLYTKTFTGRPGLARRRARRKESWNRLESFRTQPETRIETEPEFF